MIQRTQTLLKSLCKSHSRTSKNGPGPQQKAASASPPQKCSGCPESHTEVLNAAPSPSPAGGHRTNAGRARAPPSFPYTNLAATMPVGAFELAKRTGLGAGRRTLPPTPTSDRVPRPPSSQPPLRPPQARAGRGDPRSHTRSPQEVCVCGGGGLRCVARDLRLERSRGRTGVSAGPPSLGLFISPKGVWLVTLGRPWPAFFTVSCGEISARSQGRIDRS